FIFSTIGEEWGFIGVIVILALFGTFVWLGFRIARSAGDPFGQLLAVGLTALIGVTAALHIGVSLALLPATGITLPFISSGRSSCCSSAPGAASRRSCCRVSRFATASCRSSRSIGAPGGATPAGCGSRRACGATWVGC